MRLLSGPRQRTGGNHRIIAGGGLLSLALGVLCPWPSWAVDQPALRTQAEEWFRRGETSFEVRNEEAQRAFEQSLKLARQLNDGSLVARSLWRLSQIHLNLGAPEKGLRAAEEARATAQQAGDRRQEAWALDQIGNACFSLDRQPRALGYFQSAVTLMREVGDRLGEATALKDVGITEKWLGQFEPGLAHLQAALEMFRELNASDEVVSALLNIGTGYASLGAPRLALEAYQQALERARQSLTPKPMLEVCARLGYLVEAPEQKLSYFNQALTLAEELKLPDIQAWVLEGISTALYESGQVEAAIEAQQRALALHRQVRRGLGVADDLRFLGHLHLERDLPRAVDYLQQSIAISEQHDSPLAWRSYQSLAAAYQRQGELARSIECYQQAIAQLEAVRSQLVSWQHKASFSNRSQPVYQGLIAALLDAHAQAPHAGQDVRAFAVYERAKARALREAMAEAQLGWTPELEPAISQRQGQLNTRVAELQRRLVGTPLSGPQREQLLGELNQAEQEFERLLVEIKQRRPGYTARPAPEPLSLAQARALLDQQTALVAYSITEQQVFAFLLTAGSFQVVRLDASPQVLTERVQNYVDLIAQDAGGGWAAVSRRLYAELLAPLRRHLPQEITQLIIIPDGALHFLPFETLLEDAAQPGAGVAVGRDGAPTSSGPRYLLEDFTISYAPSATVLAELKAARSKPVSGVRTDLLVLANPALAPALLAQNAPRRASGQTRELYDAEGLPVAPIPFSLAEAKAVAQYAGRGSEVHTGQEASEHFLKTTQLARFRVVHFATHGLLSQQAPSRSALVLAPGAEETEDGFLQAREIYHLKLASDLVVLSACQTARGQLLASEGVQGLAQAFFQAGAQSVVASLWDVNDQRTTLFMEAFYRHLAAGRSKAAALRAAKLELLRNGSGPAPRFWAPFILIGEAAEQIPLKGPSWWLRQRRWLGLGLGILLLLLVFPFLRLLLKRRHFRQITTILG